MTNPSSRQPPRVFAALLLLTAAVGAWAACGRAPSPPPDPRQAMQPPPPPRFADNGDGTVTDQRGGLMWKQCAEGQSGPRCAAGRAERLTWAQARARADNLVFAGHDDWRIPTGAELAGLLEPGCELPAVDLTWFPNTPSGWFWLHSPEADNSTRAGMLGFAFGETGSADQRHRLHLRLVRGGAPAT